jgi:phosphate-selective porin
VRHELYDSSTSIANTTSASWLIGANYYIKGDDLKLAFNYTLGDPAGPLSNEGRFGARLQVVF